MLTLLQVLLALVGLVVLAGVLKLIALPFALLAGLLGLLVHSWLPIALVGGAIWFFNYQRQKQLPGG